MNELFRRQSGLREYVYGVAGQAGSGVQVNVAEATVALGRSATIEDLETAIHECDQREMPQTKPVPVMGEVD